MDKINVLYINLDRCIERNNNIIDGLNKLNCTSYERISGIDMNNITDVTNSSAHITNFNKTGFFIQNNYKMIIHNNRPRVLCNGEVLEYTDEQYKSIAIILSSFKALLRLINSDYEMCIIMEDDVSFKYCTDWNDMIHDIVKNAPIDWNIIKLHTSNIKLLLKDIELYNNGIMYNKIDVKDSASAMCYIIKKDIARLIINRYLQNDKKFHIPYENENANNENIIFNIPNVYMYTKPIICSMENNTTCKGDINDADAIINKIIDDFWQSKQ
jgi:hypothetical protein